MIKESSLFYSLGLNTVYEAFRTIIWVNKVALRHTKDCSLIRSQCIRCSECASS